MRTRYVLPLALLGITASACAHRFYEAEPALDSVPAESTVEVESPVRVHLSDGGVVIFRDGATISPDTIIGAGIRYDLARLDSTRVVGIGLDSVLGLESTPVEHLRAGKSALVSLGATIGTVALTIGGIVAIACAMDPKCFGSCPTVYTHDESGEVLEAELFSYSIAPLLEGRDVDAIGGRATNGVLALDIRNEAMETHFINHLQVLEVAHDTGERVVPDGGGLPVALADLRVPTRARDGAGRNVLEELSAAEDTAFATDPTQLARARDGDLEDRLDLVFARPERDSAALVLRLRNSLLNTVLFYDMMLGAAGAEALVWMADDLQRIGPAVRLGRWWVERMGMRIAVLHGTEWREVARLADTGPIAWNEIAVPLPVPTDADSVHVRLTFIADQWRIDAARLAHDFRRPAVRQYPAARVLDARGAPRDSALAAVAAPDERYVQTTAGDRFTIEFDVGTAAGARTFLLSSQGYYTEWVRPEWVRQAKGGGKFEPSDAMLREAMARWAAVRPEFERRFFETRIPTR